MDERSLDKCTNCNNKISELDSEDKILQLVYQLTKRELKCLLMLIVEKKTYSEIGIEYRIGRDRVVGIFKKSMQKIHVKGNLLGMQITLEDIKDSILRNLPQIPFLKTKSIYIVDSEKLDALCNKSYAGVLQVIPEGPEEILNKSIDFLELPLRPLNCLRGSSIYTIRELTTKSANDLLKIKNLGRKGLRDIKNALAYNQLKLEEN